MPSLFRRYRSDPRRCAVALTWFLLVCVVAAVTTSASLQAQSTGIVGMTTVALPVEMPEIESAAPAPRPAAETGITLDGVPEVEEPGPAHAATLPCTGIGLPALAAPAPGTIGNSPPRYRGQAPPAIA